MLPGRRRASTGRGRIVGDAIGQTQRDDVTIGQLPQPPVWIPGSTSLFHLVADFDFGELHAERSGPRMT